MILDVQLQVVKVLTSDVKYVKWKMFQVSFQLLHYYYTRILKVQSFNISRILISWKNSDDLLSHHKLTILNFLWLSFTINLKMCLIRPKRALSNLYLPL